MKLTNWSKLVSGDLCEALCVEKTVHSWSCKTQHSGKETVFSASIKGNQRVVFKSSQQTEPHDIFYWIDHSGEHYPSDDEFVRMIKHRVSSKLNVTVKDEDAQKLSVFPGGSASHTGSFERHTEMRDIWRLLQDNEYLLSMYYADKELFPKIAGSCGQLYASEYHNPILENEMSQMLIEEAGKNWAARVHLASLLLNLVEELDLEGLLLCDVKASHFGISSQTGRLKVLDLDVSLPKAVADSITGDGRTCSADSDCSLFDCKSKCNKKTQLCDSPVTTSNFQVVCEKVLMGWSVRGGLILAGLLMKPETPPSLAALLRQCSQHSDDPDFRQRVVATLAEMDTVLNTEDGGY